MWTRSLRAAVRFLVEQQAADGAWRSAVYGTFKAGDALTPLVLHTLRAAEDDSALSALRRGREYLASLAPTVGSHGESQVLNYPISTAALTVLVLSDPNAGQATECAAWLAYLKERQLTEDLGWQPTDPSYGGWGYGPGLPRRPPDQRAPFAEANLSATMFAVAAVCAAGGPTDPSLQTARRFLYRCQNFQDDPSQHDPAFDDGGFFFADGDPLRNKAGVRGVDGRGRQRYASYGSTTADGLRGLLACGLAPNEPRPLAARRWLERNFYPAIHPGRFAADRAALQASVYYYYCWSLAHALSACSERLFSPPEGEELPFFLPSPLEGEGLPFFLPSPLGGEGLGVRGSSARGTVRWAEALADELQRRQQPDGSWCNEAVEAREDDPLVGTALAGGALALCCRVLGER